MRLTLLMLTFVLVACAPDGPGASAAAAAEDAPSAACLPEAAGRFEAELRGALEADVKWLDAQMECEGDLRPDGKGIRLTVVGPLAAAPPRPPGERRLRFILGIDLEDAAEGPAQVLPTNLTVIVEGENLLYSTRGDERCAVENLRREPLGEGMERVSGRGYCLGPASDLAGETRVLVPTFSFTTRALVVVAPDEYVQRLNPGQPARVAAR